MRTTELSHPTADALGGWGPSPWRLPQRPVCAPGLCGPQDGISGPSGMPTAKLSSYYQAVP